MRLNADYDVLRENIGVEDREKRKVLRLLVS
jgi:hypothetical protein